MTRKNDGKPFFAHGPTLPPAAAGNRASHSPLDVARRLPHRPDRFGSPPLAAHMRAAPVLLACVLGLWALQGCAPMAVRNSPPPPAEAAADSPGGVRVMGADHRFADVSIN